MSFDISSWFTRDELPSIVEYSLDGREHPTDTEALRCVQEAICYSAAPAVPVEFNHGRRCHGRDRRKRRQDARQEWMEDERQLFHTVVVRLLNNSAAISSSF